MSKFLRVGYQCLSVSDTEDFYYAGQPVISLNKADSSAFMMFQKVNGQWVQAFYNSSDKAAYVIKAPALSFPECSPEDSYKNGAEFGGIFISVCLMGFFFKEVIKMFRSAGR